MDPMEMAGLAAVGAVGWALGRRSRHAGEHTHPGDAVVQAGTRLSTRASAAVLVAGQQATKLTARAVGITGKALAVGLGRATDLAASIGGTAQSTTARALGRGRHAEQGPAAAPPAGGDGEAPAAPTPAAPARPRARRAPARRAAAKPAS